MDFNEAWPRLIGVVLIAITLLLPRWFSIRTRAISGSALIILSLIIIGCGFAFIDRPFMQSEVVTKVWMGVITAIVGLGIGCLVTAFFDWRRRRRKPRQKRESWSAGHRDG